MAFQTVIDSVAKQRLGTKIVDKSANEYIYLKGVASTVVGSIVTFNASHQSALSVTTVRGPVAVAQAAVVANKYGWYQIYGNGQALFNGAAVAGAALYSASTGKCDDAVVSGDKIDGATVGATVSGSGLGSVLLSYPSMNGNG
jgi:hypothetical protein